MRGAGKGRWPQDGSSRAASESYGWPGSSRRAGSLGRQDPPKAKPGFNRRARCSAHIAAQGFPLLLPGEWRDAATGFQFRWRRKFSPHGSNCSILIISAVRSVTRQARPEDRNRVRRQVDSLRGVPPTTTGTVLKFNGAPSRRNSGLETTAAWGELCIAGSQSPRTCQR